jgi:hypothetical protein
MSVPTHIPGKRPGIRHAELFYLLRDPAGMLMAPVQENYGPITSDLRPPGTVEKLHSIPAFEGAF